MKRKLVSQHSKEKNKLSHNEIINESEPVLKQIKFDDKENSMNPSSSNIHTSINLITTIGMDCLSIVLSYLNTQDLVDILFISKAWSQIAVPLFIELTEEMYLNNKHLDSLREVALNEGYSSDYSGLYNEYATWKPTLGYESDELEDGYLVPEILESDSEEVEICDMAKINTDSLNENTQVEQLESVTTERNTINSKKIDKRIPFGSPLCKNSIVEQYQLVQDQLTPKDYKELVNKQLGITITENLPQNPFLFYDLMNNEKSQVDTYITEIVEAKNRDSGASITVGNFSGCKVYSDDNYFEEYQATDLGLCFYCFRSGMDRLLRQAGVVYYEPQVTIDSIQLLKDFIESVIRMAYDTKFGDREKPLEFKEPEEQYQVFWENYDEEVSMCDDSLDADLKINGNDIIQALEKVHGIKMLMDYTEKEIIEEIATEDESESEEESTEIKEEEKKKEAEEEIDEISLEEEDFSELIDKENDIEINEEEVNNTTLNQEQVEEDINNDDSFIDDSELENIKDFDLEKLNDDNLQDRLIKVSIKVHEEVYGKEVTRKEKLYLKNWFGYGPLFYSRCASHLGDDNPIDQQVTDCEMTENNILKEEEVIEKERKEDLNYFGYSLYNDGEEEYINIYKTNKENSQGIEEGNEENENKKVQIEEQASEEATKEYHLRRLLREQSYKCIKEYFHGKDEIKVDTTPPSYQHWLW
ncbi:hypothetical protein ABK040_002639 [Willaertia magna]